MPGRLLDDDLNAPSIPTCPTGMDSHPGSAAFAVAFHSALLVLRQHCSGDIEWAHRVLSHWNTCTPGGSPVVGLLGCNDGLVSGQSGKHSFEGMSIAYTDACYLHKLDAIPNAGLSAGNFGKCGALLRDD